MKLPIKKEYFDKIVSGEKEIEFRDAHITFVCEETGETITKKVFSCNVELRPDNFHKDVLEDDFMIVFDLTDY